MGNEVIQLENEIECEEDRRQIIFIGKQLLLFTRHRYFPEYMIILVKVELLVPLKNVREQ